MALRCLLFTSDAGTAKSVCQALTELSVETEHCTVAAESVQKLTQHSFNLLIVDWDSQTESASLLKIARERKVSERPLTVAIVSGDPNVSQALQAGANSILRKPIVVAQVRNSLASARDLLRSRHDAALSNTQAAAAAAAANASAVRDSANSDKKTLRAGEFLQSTTSPGAQFVTEADVQNKIQKTIEAAAVAQVDPVKELEPMAAAVETGSAAPPASFPDVEEPRGLARYLKRPSVGSPSTTTTTEAATSELLRQDQPPAGNQSEEPAQGNLVHTNAANPAPTTSAKPGQKAEAELFAYMSGDSSSESGREATKPRPGLRRLILAGPLVAVCVFAYVAVPRARWHQNLQLLSAYTTHLVHGWLNPQTPAPVQAPTTHENFGLAGDEYKLPVAQNIPDATTDPTQIRVVPVIDPTAKPNPATSTPDTTPEDATPTDNTAQSSGDKPQPVVQVQETAQPVPASTGAGEASPPLANSRPTIEPGSADPSPSSIPPVRHDPMQSASKGSSRPQAPPITSASKPSAGIPSSLRSQLAPATPDPSGGKGVETALPSIEPVKLPEANARSLLSEQTAPEYPAAARVQQGTVVLQVLIGRDGSVQDAKFLQGSFAFARAAIDAVKQWRFKPYNFNGRPVSVQTTLTVIFKPAS